MDCPDCGEPIKHIDEKEEELLERVSRLTVEDTKRFTMISGDYGYIVKLKVGNQYFTVTPEPYETIEEAEWMQTQLCKALANLIKIVKNDNRKQQEP